jgi:hypothetical protein
MTAQAPLDRALGAALLDRPDGAGLTAGLDRLLERAGGVAAGCEVMALRQPVRHQRLAGTWWSSAWYADGLRDPQAAPR